VRIGDLVRYCDRDYSSYGIVTKVLSESLIIVLWVGSSQEYMETVNNLEVLS